MTLRNKTNQYRGARKSFLKAVFFLSDTAPCDGCGKPMTREQATIDHKVPVVASGPHHPGNFQVMHGDCNNLKGSRQSLGRKGRKQP